MGRSCAAHVRGVAPEFDDIEDLPVAAAVERYIRRRQSDAAESTVNAQKYRLKLFREWCEGRRIEAVGELRRYDLDEYYDVRAVQVEPVTLEGEMYTLKTFVEYLAHQLGAVEDGLVDAIRIPDLDEEERSDETRLEEGPALALITHYRNHPPDQASRAHVWLELAWHTGARMGGIRALDLQDVSTDEAYVHFRHRPDTGTPLKNKRAGERAVAIPESTAEILETYIEYHRDDVSDEHGRQPLLTSQQGRPIKNTLRNWSYQSTQPCLHSQCPHGKERESCQWTEWEHASKCPSSRSPHQIRTGSITWQLNIGIPPEIVAQRVNATMDVIEKHYDQETPRERMERRRRHHIDKMDESYE